MELLHNAGEQLPLLLVNLCAEAHQLTFVCR